MKKLFFAVIFLMGITTMAQNREIEFVEASWKKQLEMANNQSKLIFFDAYTSWCAPCKAMAKNVFTKNEVADLFNNKFINVKYDMEKGEGISLKEQYKVSAYPTYLFIDGNGEVVHKIVGSVTAEEFVNEAKKALNPENTIYGLAKKFEASNHSEASAIAYLEALSKAYESEKRSAVSKLYFDKLSKSDLLGEHHWQLVVKYLNNPSSEAFVYLYNNKSKLEEKYDPKQVNNYFNGVFGASTYAIKNAYKKNSGIEQAKENTKAIRSLLTKENEFSNQILAKLDLIEFAASNKWKKYVKKLNNICADTNFSNKSYLVIEAANDLVTLNKEKYYKDVMNWADALEKDATKLFTQIQLAELRKRVLKRQGKTAEAELMANKEQKLRKEAADKRLMTPFMIKD